jgi:C-terminal processing protease CtpA/Prc
MRFANVNSYPSTYEEAARGLAFSDTLLVVSVATGSAAARAGVAIGDRVIGVNDGMAPRGPNAPSPARAITTRGHAGPSLTLRHGDTTFLVDATARSDGVAPAACRRLTAA